MYGNAIFDLAGAAFARDREREMHRDFPFSGPYLVTYKYGGKKHKTKQKDPTN